MPGQPRGDERIRQIEQVVGVQRAPDSSTVTTGLPLAAAARTAARSCGIATAVRHRVGRDDVAVGFGVRRFADHRDDGIELARIDVLAVGAVRHVGPRPALRASPPAPYRRCGIVGVRVVRALPGQRPAAGLVRHVVGALADHQHALAAACSGSTPLSFFSSTSDSRTASRASSRCCDGASPCRRSGCRTACVEQARAQLHPQDARHRIVDARHRDLARLHLLRSCWR